MRTARVARCHGAASCRACLRCRLRFLGAIQGVTEFLPISSSAHLYLSHLARWAVRRPPRRGSSCGNVIALIAAFGWDLGDPRARRWARDLDRRCTTRSLWLKLAIASVRPQSSACGEGRPETHRVASLAGSHDDGVRLPAVVGRPGVPGNEQPAPGWRTCLVVGFAQALALVPASRVRASPDSGSSDRAVACVAARFSFCSPCPSRSGPAARAPALSSDCRPRRCDRRGQCGFTDSRHPWHHPTGWVAGFGAFFATACCSPRHYPPAPA